MSMRTPLAVETTQGTEIDNTSHNYLNIVEPDEHNGVLTLELLESCSKDFRKPVVFRKMVPLPERVQTREFIEIAADQKLIWRERRGEGAVGFRNKDGKTDYNYVSGREGTAKEYLDEIFVHKKDVYAHLGYVSSGFADLHKHQWGSIMFDYVREEVFRGNWFQIPQWKLTGHAFLGNNTESYCEPSSGAPGSDWHMFPTTNLFVMIAGKKKWMSRPPQPGDQHRNLEEVVFPTGGRERPQQEHEYDTVYLESGDLLFNVPYEWHKVVNHAGYSLGAAFRVIDTEYIDRLLNVPAVKSHFKLKKMNEEMSHLATSLNHASQDPIRMQMCLNTVEMMICAATRLPFME